MTDHSLIQAARRLRKRQEQYQAISPGARQERDDTIALLAGVEDLVDRVALIERNQRRINERLEFLGHLSRMLGHEDWTVPDPDEPGSPVTAEQACVPGSSGAGELVPPELAGIRQPS